MKAVDVAADTRIVSRIQRFCDWLNATYMTPYRPKTTEEQRWIDDGGEPPAHVAAYYRNRPTGDR